MNELIAVAVIVASLGGEETLLRAHFAQVDRELQARDVSHLSAAQRNARAVHIARLREYAARGVFPRNTRHPGELVPYFIDDVGTRCAMAFLIEQSGAGEFVARVASRLNYAYVAEIARDPELGAPLLAWLDSNGLSLEEAARIQPAYDGGGCCTIDDPEPQVATSYKVGSGANIVTGLSTVVLNASLVRLGLSRRVGGWIGLGVGAAGLALGAAAMDEGDSYSTLRTVNTGVGLLAATLGLHAILSRPSTAPTATAVAQDVPRLTGGPWVDPEGRSGVMVSLRF